MPVLAPALPGRGQASARPTLAQAKVASPGLAMEVMGSSSRVWSVKGTSHSACSIGRSLPFAGLAGSVGREEKASGALRDGERLHGSDCGRSQDEEEGER
ncbi:hypothetical protein NL676_005799 [Syzygium grande]|nr:hypothetical protein NL676_005799 [Syzygium grande]